MANQNTNTTKVVTGKVRLSFVHLFEPHAQNEGQDEKYSVMLLIPKTDKETLNKMNRAIEAAKEQGKSGKWNGKIPAGLKTTLRDGDEEQDTEERPEFKGHMFMNVSAKTAPGVVGTARDARGKLEPITDPNEVYSGCYARVSINFFPYAAAGNKGISAGLNNVQKVADGEFLGGRSKAEDDFDDWADEENEDDFDLLG